MKLKKFAKPALALTIFAIIILAAAFPPNAHAAAPDETITSHIAEIDGVKLHYLTAGHGTPLILLHGYAETSLMWKPIIPLLAKRFTVIAPDLPGIGDSGHSCRRSGHEKRRHPHPRSRQIARRAESGSRWPRHRPHGRLRLRRAVPCGSHKARPHGRLPSRRAPAGRPFTTIPTSGISASTVRLPKPWFKAASTPTSTISGMTSPPTRITRFRKPIAKPTSRHTHGRAACMPDGTTSSPSSRPPRISLNSLKPG